MKLSIIIPCYNEPETIGVIIDQVVNAALPAGWEREIIVVDDGSTEETKVALNVVLELHPEVRVITRPKNGGKGAALKSGFAVATGDFLMIQDADLEYDPNDIKALLAPIDSGETRVVFGSRQLTHNNVSGRFYFYWGGRLVNIFFNTCFGVHLTDLTTCYKVFARSFVPEVIAQPSDTFVFDAIELSYVLSKKGEKVVEVPISYSARDAEHGKKLKASDGILCLTRCVALFTEPYARAIRFLVVGGTAMFVNIIILYLLTDVFGLWYVLSEVVAFVVALLYNFALQKVWTFKGAQGSSVRQGFLFFGVNLVNLALNTAILYGLVEFFGLWYIAAQIIATVLIACESFFFYRAIFRTV